jgi:hypothetical protein
LRNWTKRFVRHTNAKRDFLDGRMNPPMCKKSPQSVWGDCGVATPQNLPWWGVCGRVDFINPVAGNLNPFYPQILLRLPSDSIIILSTKRIVIQIDDVFFPACLNSVPEIFRLSEDWIAFPGEFPLQGGWGDSMLPAKVPENIARELQALSSLRKRVLIASDEFSPFASGVTRSQAMCFAEGNVPQQSSPRRKLRLQTGRKTHADACQSILGGSVGFLQRSCKTHTPHAKADRAGTWYPHTPTGDTPQWVSLVLCAACARQKTHAAACHGFGVGCVGFSTSSKNQHTPPEWECAGTWFPHAPTGDTH